MKTAANIIGTVTLVLFALGTAVISDWSLADEDYDVCPIGKPIASWNFSKGDLPGENTDVVLWNGDHGGIVDIPESNLKGIRFNYRGKGPDKDSTSEWRYKLKQPLSRSWEYLTFYQPVNFTHRFYLRLESEGIFSEADWRIGDEVVNHKGMHAKVVGVRDNFLFISDFPERFDFNWGDNHKITNLRSSAFFNSKDSRMLNANNKFSTQWQGKYSNAGMTVETGPSVPNKGGEVGVGYFTPKINTSKAHKNSGTANNTLPFGKPVAFDPRNNGEVVEFVVERIRSTDKDVKDASYRIWKRTENSEWVLIFENNGLYVWQPDNYFDNGYVLGWSNSGYSEDTTFYLLGWQLWAEKPTFLP